MDCIVVGNFPPPANGQTLATRRLAGLLERSRRVACVNLSASGEPHVQADARVRWGRIQHYLGLRAALRNELNGVPDAPVLWASISPTPYGHARDLLVVTPALGAARPVVAVVHWGNFDGLFRSPLTRPTALRLVRRLNAFVFLDESLAAACSAWIPEHKRAVIPNTIDADLLFTQDELDARRQQGGSPLRLLFLSNMIAEKGYMDALHALHEARRRGVDVILSFAGGWTSEATRTAFSSRVQELGLHEAVHHHGPIHERHRIKRLYLESDVFILPTYYPTEAQPLTIIEALNAGLPVITTRHSGIPHMVRQEQEALFVEPRRPDQIADAVARLADPARRQLMSAAARARFEETYSPDAVRRKWEVLLDRICAPYPPDPQGQGERPL